MHFKTLFHVPSLRLLARLGSLGVIALAAACNSDRPDFEDGEPSEENTDFGDTDESASDAEADDRPDAQTPDPDAPNEPSDTPSNTQSPGVSPAPTDPAVDASAPPDPEVEEPGTTPTECAPNSTECVNDQLRRCGADGTWNDATDCVFVCVAGACTGECTPGDVDCDENDALLCDESGQWTVAEQCSAACEQGACVDQCTEGVSDCANDSFRSCVEGAWVVEEVCPFLCSTSGCTGECSPGDTGCDGAAITTCDADGTWTVGDECPFLCAAGQCGGECEAGTTRCLTGSVQQTCSEDATWGDDTACEFLCDEDACTGSCVPGERRCTNGNTTSQLCDENGSWAAETSCVESCAEGLCTGLCDEGSAPECVGTEGQRRVCTGGQWVTSQCEFACTGGACSGVCTPGSKECSNATTPRTCGPDGQWDTDPACQFVCAAGFCSGECTPGAQRCDSASGRPQLCSSAGTWQNEPACASGSVCSAGECVCSASLTECGGSCVDLDTNATHCGACGHDCYGGSCVDGVCGPVELAAGQSRAETLAVSSTHVYWTDTGDGGAIRRVSKTGGTVETLASDQGSSPVLALTSSNVYWEGPDSIVKANLDGTSQTDFVTTSEAVDAIVIADNRLYWNERGVGSETTIYSKALSGGSSATEAVHETPVSMFTVAGGCVYFRTQDSPRSLVRECDEGSPVGRYSSTETFSFNPSGATDDTMLYFGVPNSGLRRLPLSGNTASTEVVAGLGPRFAIVDGDILYYIDGSSGGAPACTTNWSLLSVPKTPGSQPTTLIPAPMACPQWLTQDATSLYWSNFDDDTVMRMAKPL